MEQLFTQEARKHNVFPLDNRAFVRALSSGPSATAGISEFVYTGEISGIPAGAAPPWLGRSFTIKAEIEVPQNGAEGMLATQGGQTSGWLEQPVPGLFISTSHRCHVRLDNGRTDCVDPDSFGGVFERGGFSKPYDRVFAGVVKR